MSNCWCGGLVDNYSCTVSVRHDPFDDGSPMDPSDVRRLYVSGPMSGMTDLNYPEFHRVSNLLIGAGFTVVNPAETEELAGYRDILREDLRSMLNCQAIATLNGWEHSSGARNEVMVAGILGMHVKPYEYWMGLGSQS